MIAEVEIIGLLRYNLNLRYLDFICKVYNIFREESSYELITLETLVETYYDDSYKAKNYTVNNGIISLTDATIVIYDLTEQVEFKLVDYVLDLQGVRKDNFALYQHKYNSSFRCIKKEYETVKTTNLHSIYSNSIDDWYVEKYFRRAFNSSSFIDLFTIETDLDIKTTKGKLSIYNELQQIFHKEIDLKENRIIEYITNIHSDNMLERIIRKEKTTLDLYNIGIIKKDKEVVKRMERKNFNQGISYLVGIERLKYKALSQHMVDF